MESPDKRRGFFVMIDLEIRLNIHQIKALMHRLPEEPKLLDFMLAEAISGEERNAINSSWILTHAYEEFPEMMNEESAKKLIEHLKKVKLGTIKRNIIRIFQFVDVPNQRAEIFYLMLDFFSRREEDIAVRAFALTCLEVQIQHFPEAIIEIMYIIEAEEEWASPAMMVRMKRFRKRVVRMGL